MKAPQPAGWGILKAIHEFLGVGGIGAAYLIVPVVDALGNGRNNRVRVHVQFAVNIILSVRLLAVVSRLFRAANAEEHLFTARQAAIQGAEHYGIDR